MSSSPIASPSSSRRVIEPDSEPSDNEGQLSTKSLTGSIFNYVEENGRSYHRYAEGSYHFPCDETEVERLELQHEMLTVLFNGRTHFAPLREPRKILDIGTGTGNWAIDMANAFPDCEVIGTDLSPIQPDWVPDNVHFVIDDAQDEWLEAPSSYSYIHTRMLLGCFHDFRSIIRKAFQTLVPGGYLESQELLPTLFCDDHSLTSTHPFLDWIETQDRAARAIGRPLRIADKLKRWYEEAGFVDVQEKVFKLPLNPWPKDEKLKMLGRMSESNWLDGIQGMSLAWLHRGLGWSKEEIEVYLIGVRKGIRDTKVHAYHKVYVVWGRKPDVPSSIER